MSTDLGSIRAMLALGEEAVQLKAIVGDDGFAHWWTPKKGSTPIEFTPGPRDDSENNPYRPLIFDGKQGPFFAAAANARPAIAELVAEVEHLRYQLDKCKGHHGIAQKAYLVHKARAVNLKDVLIELMAVATEGNGVPKRLHKGNPETKVEWNERERKAWDAARTATDKEK